MTKLYKSIGLMSGTSMDGVDLALIESNGKEIINRSKFLHLTYEQPFKERLYTLIYKHPSPQQIKEVERELTMLHVDLVNHFLAENKLDPKEIDIIGFHGHTILHLPQKQITWQIGNAHLLAEETGINVVGDFRTRDVTIGGQGAPLVPIYHFYLLHNQQRPTAVLNIGGISNITYFADNNENNIQAFDVCFGNAPFDDLVKTRLGMDFDANGQIAKSGNVDFIIADHVLQNAIFHRQPPKSFDRNDFATILAPITNLKTEDALATFAYMHARTIAINIDFFAVKPREIFVCGGGRKNIALMNEMKKWLSGIEVRTTEEIGFNGDAIEADAFAFLAIRHLLNLPISFPSTTGISTPSCGGTVFNR